MATQTATAPADLAAPESTSRARIGLLSGTLAGTSVLGLVGTVLWPSGSGDFYTYDDVAPVRDRFYWTISLVVVFFLLNVPLQALAGLVIVQRRGSAWATAGAAVMWLGAAAQATGMAAWTLLYYFTAGPGLPASTARPFVDGFRDDGRLFGLTLIGELVVVLGTILLAVGMFRSRAVPWWVPALTLFVAASVVLPSAGWAGLIGAVPVAAGSIAMAWYAWRRTP